MLNVVSIHAKSLERYLAYTNKTFFFIIGIFEVKSMKISCSCIGVCIPRHLKYKFKGLWLSYFNR